MTPDQQRLRRLWAYLSECWVGTKPVSFPIRAEDIEELQNMGYILADVTAFREVGFILADVIVPLLPQHRKEEA